MSKFLKNVSLRIILLFLVVVAVLPNQVKAADVLNTNCPITISIKATPSEVKKWSDLIEVKTTIHRTAGSGFYCGTTDTVKFKILYLFPGGQATDLRTGGTTTFLPNASGQGQDSEAVDIAQFQMSARGGTNQTHVTFGAEATVERVVEGGAYRPPFTIEANPAAGVRLNKNTTVPPVTPNPGGGSNTNNPSNTNAPNPGLNNNQINTGVTASFNVDLDSDLGTFFNPLQANSLPELISIVVRILFVLIGIVAVIVIIVAGFRMVVDSGNETQLKKAKDAITWAVIGLIVSILAFSIVAIIQKVIQG